MMEQTNIQDACLGFVLAVVAGLERDGERELRNILASGRFSLPQGVSNLAHLDASLHGTPISLHYAIHEMVGSSDRGVRVTFADPFYEPIKGIDAQAIELSTAQLCTLYVLDSDLRELSGSELERNFAKCRSFNAFCLLTDESFAARLVDEKRGYTLSEVVRGSAHMFVEAFDGTDFIRWNGPAGDITPTAI